MVSQVVLVLMLVSPYYGQPASFENKPVSSLEKCYRLGKAWVEQMQPVRPEDPNPKYKCINMPAEF